MLGFGAIIGLRAGLGLLLGAVVAWAVIAPLLIDSGAVVVDSGGWFQPLVGWLLWPGVTLMVTASITSFAITAWRAFSQRRSAGAGAALNAGADELLKAAEEADNGALLRLVAFSGAAGFAVVLQIHVFDIHWTMAVLAIPMAFALATVAARVTGETGIPPIGAIGKVSQLSFGLLAPGQPVTNLMTANVAGGAAGQSADLLNDLRAGHEIGASPAAQIAAQCVGVLTGSLVDWR